MAEGYLSGIKTEPSGMALGKQEIYRERTFGSYPTVHEIKRSQRRTERDSLVRLLRNSARQQSIDGDAAPSSQARYNLTSRDDDRRSRLTNLLVVSHDRTGGSSYSTARGKEESKLPPLNDLHIRPPAPPARSMTQIPVSNTGGHAASKRNQSSVQPTSVSALNDPFRKVENLNTHFRRSKSVVRRHFWISPEWLSEGLTIKRLQLENRSDPMKFGWI